MTTTSVPETVGRASGRRGLLIAVQVGYLLFLPAWLGLAVAATMGLANTDSLWSGPGILFAWSYPVALVAAAVVSHVVWHRSTRAAHLWNLLPLPWVLIGAALLGWIFSADFSFGP